jgi:oxygen-independent coproporphyrinogen III oxidase
MDLPASDLPSLDAAISRGDYADYVYMYPPRQAYRQLSIGEDELLRTVKLSFQERPEINLYIHIPFCAQICRFCNLYTTTVRGGSIYETYVSRVLEEAAAYAESGLTPHNVVWRTLYLGGGTPSALPLDALARLISGLKSYLRISDIDETAIEVAPETVTSEYLAGLRAIGFDRVSMGFQSTSPIEIRRIGRSYPISKQRDIAQEAMDLGFRNLCLDLIFGLPDQDETTWRSSVRAVIAMQPHTICCYQWTSRPHTGFSKMGFTKPPGNAMRGLYEVACSELAAAGYSQETHVRWIRDGGGYLQKQYHWGLETLLGLGAGARSYLWQTDLRNGYSISNRSQPLASYLSAAGMGWQRSPEGYLVSEDERRRKAVVLGIHNLDRSWFSEIFGDDVLSVFGPELAGLEDRSLLEISPERLRLTRVGRAHRDTIVQLFFSDKVRELVTGWDYEE